jgi:hypothetical protein
MSASMRDDSIDIGVRVLRLQIATISRVFVYASIVIVVAAVEDVKGFHSSPRPPPSIPPCFFRLRDKQKRQSCYYSLRLSLLRVHAVKFKQSGNSKQC